MKTIVFTLLVFMSTTALSQDTFSICAFDPQTGEVGSAGATCIESSAVSCIIISDVHPGVGVVHTQSYWIPANQDYGHELMLENLSAQQIIDSLVMYDAEGNPSIRQYGVVRMDNDGSTASYTGENCFDYKNHITGPNYAIQGNILLGQQILDSMETRFNNTQGDLACKLMAAMQGAKVVGADTRCEDDGISSFSAFIRVAQIDDDMGDLSLDISVNTYSTGTEPIDSLQTLFEQAGGCALSIHESTDALPFQLYQDGERINIVSPKQFTRVSISDMNGKVIYTKQFAATNSFVCDAAQLASGVYVVKVSNGSLQSSRSLVKQ